MKLPFVIKINIVSIWKFIRWFRRKILRKKIQKRNFGYVPDHFDSRDTYYRLRNKIKDLPESTEKKNINMFPVRYDQGQIGSCIGNGCVAAFRRTLHVNKQPDYPPSRLFAYYIARTDENKKEDSGASIRDAFKAINNFGICDEKYCPYSVVKFADKPSPAAFIDATQHQSIKYERIYPSAKDLIKDALNNSFCVVFGIVLHESFMSDKVKRTGIIPNPSCWEEEIGGHCMTIFDYEKDGVWVLNSWGDQWGIEGICFIPWEYLLSKHASDFWIFYTTE